MYVPNSMEIDQVSFLSTVAYNHTNSNFVKKTTFFELKGPQNGCSHENLKFDFLRLPYFIYTIV